MQPGRPAGGDKRQTGLNKGLHLTRSESTLIPGLPAGAAHLHTKVGRCAARTWGHCGGLDLRSPTPLHRCSVTSLSPQPLRGSCSAPPPLSAELTAPAPLGDTPSVLLPLLCPRHRGKTGPRAPQETDKPCGEAGVGFLSAFSPAQGPCHGGVVRATSRGQAGSWRRLSRRGRGSLDPP